MSENLKRAESLFNRIMNQGKEPPKPTHNHHPQNHHHHHHQNHQNHHHHQNHHNHHTHNNRNKHRNEIKNHQAMKIPGQVVASLENQHILPYCWTIWHHSRYSLSKKKDDKVNYLQRTQELELPQYGTNDVTKYIGSLEQMWTSFSFLVNPKDVSMGTEYFVFKSGINPVWEDPLNTQGGRWVFKFPREDGSRSRVCLIWERLIIRLLIGDLPGEDREKMLNEINGVVISIRKEEDIISIWNSNVSRIFKRQNAIKRGICEFMNDVIREVDEMNGEPVGDKTRGVLFKYRVHADYKGDRDREELHQKEDNSS